MQIKNIIIAILLISSLSSCDNLFKQFKSQDGYDITVNLKNAGEVKEGFLEEITSKDLTVIDTAKIENNVMHMTGVVAEKGIYRIRFTEEYFILLVLDNQDIKIDLDLDDMKSYKITGSPESILMKDILVRSRGTREKIQELEMQYRSVMNGESENAEAVMMAVQTKYGQIVEEHNNYLLAFADTISSPIIGIFTANMLDPELHAAKFERIAKMAQEKEPDSKYTKEFTEKLALMNSITIGKPAPDITLADANGNMLSLSSLKGKVVMLDFWASWCKPCRVENPNVVRIYNEYKDKGFKIFSVSLDEKKEAWLGAIEQDGLVWENHVSDLKGWQSEGAKLYNIKGIPATFLIDENGIIIAENLRGESLEQKLKEIFSQKETL